MINSFRRWTAIAVLALTVVFSGFVQAQTTAAEVVNAADKFLATLSAEQRQKVSYAFDDEQQRARWSNLPTGFVPRGGISLKQMTPVQREAAIKLLATVLSPMGLQKVNEIREADDDFKANGSRRGPGGPGGPPPGGPPPNAQGGPPPGFGRPSGPGGGAGQGGRPSFSSDEMFGSNLYYISFLGKPSTTTPWILQFGGHHLALNVVIAGSRGALAPALTGAQPAVYTSGGKTVRVLAQENDKAFALLDALDASQRKQAILDYRIDDLVMGPGRSGETIVPEGVKASAMNDAQRALLMDLVAEWVGIVNTRYADARLAEIRAGLADTWFAWSGPATHAPGRNGSAYYRIQGPKLFIEFSPQGVGGDPTMHVHTIYRDPTNDYGSSWPVQ